MAKLPFFDLADFRIIGHRGAAGSGPENTLVSVEKALSDGANLMEIDLQESKDGEILVFHDATLERTTNGQGKVSDWNLKELKKFDAGYCFTADGGKTYPYRDTKITIPTLEEFFTGFPTVKAIVEIKDISHGFIERLLAIIRRNRREDGVLLATEKDEIMTEIRRQVREQRITVATGFSYGEASAFMNWVWKRDNRSFTPPGNALQIPCEYQGLQLITESSVRAAHEIGVEIHAWTINQVEEMTRLIQMGVDGIVTDFPNRLRDLRAKQAGNTLPVPPRPKLN